MESINEYLSRIKKIDCKNVIYGLSDPRNGEIRYIGKTINLYNRIRRHYQKSKLNKQTHKNNWLNKLLQEGVRVDVTILEYSNSEKALDYLEIKWLNHYKELGCKLVNSREGGTGGKLSPESIEKMKLTKKLNPQDKYWLNKKFSKEHKKNISESKKGKSLSDDHKKKLSQSLKGVNTWSKGKKLSDETKYKMSKSRSGKPKNNKSVYQMDKDGEIIKLWDYPLQAETILGLSRGKIHSVCIGKRKTTGGFKWEYK